MMTPPDADELPEGIQLMVTRALSEPVTRVGLVTTTYASRAISDMQMIYAEWPSIAMWSAALDLADELERKARELRELAGRVR